MRVLGVSSRTREYAFYDAVLVEDAYKGCLKARSRIQIRTARSSAKCGTTFASGQEYLIHGDTVRAAGAASALHTGSCNGNGNGAWRELSEDDLAFLRSRYNCCGTSCACADGSSPVNCFVDPCDVSSCEVKGAVCESNYCGGCNAEWYDESGTRVCTNECDYEDSSRRYVARDPETCATVRFQCEPGAMPFFDDCGCGCETLECEPSSCGPVLGMPNTLCPDGVTWAGPTGRCLRQLAGGCGWEVLSCSDEPCAASSQCRSGQHCTTEDGVCNPPPGCSAGQVCPAVCYGVCAQ